MPEQYVATTRENALESAKSVYAMSSSLYWLKEATREKALTRIGYVGLPCQAFRKMPIAIFCYENFYPASLKAIVEGLGEESLSDVVRMRCSSGRFLMEGKKGVSVALRQAYRYIQDGDRICPDLVSEWAGISVGSVGSEPGWNTVFLRTKTGRDLFRRAVAAGKLEVKEIGERGLRDLEKLAKEQGEEKHREAQGAGAIRDTRYILLNGLVEGVALPGDAAYGFY